MVKEKKEMAMGKKSKKKFIIGTLILVVLLIIAISIILAVSQTSYQSITFGHGGDQVWVTTPSGADTIDNVLSGLTTLESQVFPNVTPNVTTVVTPPPTSSADFLVRVDQGTPCPDGYDWIGHIHAFLNSGIALDSFETNDYRQASTGWLSLCLKSSDKTQKSVVALLVANQCSPTAVDGDSCPAGYSQMGVFTRYSSDCNPNAPQLDPTQSSRSPTFAAGGTMIICQKGMPEYSITTGSCGSLQTLGAVLATNNGGLQYFCKSSDQTAQVQTTQNTNGVAQNSISQDNIDTQCSVAKYYRNGQAYYRNANGVQTLCP